MSRVEGASLTELAAALDLPYKTLHQRRARAEAKVVKIIEAIEEARGFGSSASEAACFNAALRVVQTKF